MKLSSFFIMAVPAMLLASCSDKEQLTETSAATDYTAVVEGYGAPTRSYNAGSGKFKWSAGDNIVAWNGSAMQEMTMKGGEDTDVATYTRPSFVPRSAAVFPTSACKSYDGTTLTVNYPTTRTSFIEGEEVAQIKVDDPLVAYFQKGETVFNFHHVGGVFQFNVAIPSGIDKFVVTFDKGVTGDFTINADDPACPIAVANDGTDNNTVTFTFDKTTESGMMTFLVAVPTGEYTLNVAAYNGDTEVSRFPEEGNSSSNTVKRGAWIVMPEITLADYTGVIEQSVASADELATAISEGKKNIVLTDDITTTKNLFLAQTQNIDLNGHKLSAGYVGINNDNSNVTIKNGDLEVGANRMWVDSSNSNLIIEDVDITSNGSTQELLAIGNTVAGGDHKGNVVTLKNTTLTTNSAVTYQIGITIYNANTLNLDNVTINHSWFGITQQGIDPGSTITLNDCNITGVYAALYLSNHATGQKNTLTINGGTFTSQDDTPIEVKKTDITVKNASINAKATTQKYTLNGGGAGAVGYGIALSGYVAGTAYEGSTTFEDNNITLGYTGSDAIKIAKYNGTEMEKVE